MEFLVFRQCKQRKTWYFWFSTNATSGKLEISSFLPMQAAENLEFLVFTNASSGKPRIVGLPRMQAAEKLHMTPSL